MAAVFRIAIRAEGAFANAYYARLDSMEEAVLLGSLRERLVAVPEVFTAWLAVIRLAVAALNAEVTGATSEFSDPYPAPEHERAGHS